MIPLIPADFTAEGVGFEPTDSLLSSAFKALALGRYANPPERDSPADRRSGPILTEPAPACAQWSRDGGETQRPPAIFRARC
jgi:hypothetical protein